MLGNAFLKKYFFDFDDNNKKILFYKEDKNYKSDKSEIIQEKKSCFNWYNSGKMFVVLIIMISFLQFLGSIFEK